ncbi:MAG: algA [Planctomycetaceae bacterium]|nr:algA [Planctomycetaceae bacterium]
MRNSLYAVIMAGGSGTRFWPASRRLLPKQFLTLAGPRTMLQTTVERCTPLIPLSRVRIVTNAVQAAEVARELPDLAASQILVEPCGRNTAPCIGLAAIQLLQTDPDAVMVVLPADHVIHPVSYFQDAVERAAAIVSKSPETFVLFGVPPTYPATGFGYIERGAAHTEREAFQVGAFREKPSRAVAEEFLQSGRHYWNCGIFVWRAAAILKALEEFQPAIFEGLQRIVLHTQTKGWEHAVEQEFPQLTSISIDHGVLEKARDVVVLEAPFEWDDVGSWLALQRLLGIDVERNTVSGLHCGVDTHGCVIRTTDQHLIATLGVEDLIIVHTPDATLVASKANENSIRDLVAELERRGLDRFL